MAHNVAPRTMPAAAALPTPQGKATRWIHEIAAARQAGCPPQALPQLIASAAFSRNRKLPYLDLPGRPELPRWDPDYEVSHYDDFGRQHPDCLAGLPCRCAEPEQKRRKEETERYNADLELYHARCIVARESNQEALQDYWQAHAAAVEQPCKHASAAIAVAWAAANAPALAAAALAIDDPTSEALSSIAAAEFARKASRLGFSDARQVGPQSPYNWCIIGLWLAMRDRPDLPFWLPLVDPLTGAEISYQVSHQQIIRVLSPKHNNRADIPLHLRVVQRQDEAGRLRYTVDDLNCVYNMNPCWLHWLHCQYVQPPQATSCLFVSAQRYASHIVLFLLLPLSLTAALMPSEYAAAPPCLRR